MLLKQLILIKTLIYLLENDFLLIMFLLQSVHKNSNYLMYYIKNLLSIILKNSGRTFPLVFMNK